MRADPSCERESVLLRIMGLTERSLEDVSPSAFSGRAW